MLRPSEDSASKLGDRHPRAARLRLPGARGKVLADPDRIGQDRAGPGRSHAARVDAGCLTDAAIMRLRLCDRR